MSKSNRPFEYELAAIDIDETLIGPDKQVGRANRRAIEALRSRGCRVVLASGRRHANMLPYYAELGLDDYVVSSQGARVQHATTGEVLHRALLKADLAAPLVEEGLRRGFGVMLWLDERVFTNRRTEWIGAYERLADDPVTLSDLGAMSHHAAEKVVWTADPAVVAATYPELAGRLDGKATTTVTEHWALEFSDLQANKRDGVAALARKLGVRREAVLAFGDGNNDVEMLAWAGIGVAMPHGRKSAHAAARHVAPEGDRESALARGIDLVLRHANDAMVA